jgi:chemotaxis protein MotB
MEAEQQIIVIKKKGGHGGHHGGAWKVAYADFVTAMMSLFIVLWLMNTTPKPVQEAIAGYFNDPKGTASKKGSIGPDAQKGKPVEKKDDMTALKLDLIKAIEKMNLLNSVKKQIEITVTQEGLRVELIEDEKGTFFELGKAKPTPVLGAILKVLSGQLKDLPNNLSIEGYTDARPYANADGYGNWELSADRANEARREMQNDGIRQDQVSQVRGFADQRLHVPDKPFDAANRRISLIVQDLKFSTPATVKAGEPVKTATSAIPSEARKAATASSGEMKQSGGAKSGGETKPAPETPAKKEGFAQGLMARAKGMFSHK